MMSEIKFIPLIELPTRKDKDSEVYPSGTSLTNSYKWDLYQKKELSKNYKNIPDPISPGIYQYKLFDIELGDLESAIKLHISDTNINDSCSFFGGYAVSINGKIELYPQCCGLLEEIKDWSKILNESFEQFYLMQCHPSPLIAKELNEIKIQCKEENGEAFFPKTKEIIFVEYELAKKALLKTLDELKEFSIKINNLSNKFGETNLSEKLIWGGK